MIRLVLTWLGLSVVASAAAAQGVSPAVHPGSRSLNFTFGGLGGFGLTGTGPAGGVGISYFTNANTAVRVGLQVREYTRTLSWNSATGAAGTDGSESGVAGLQRGSLASVRYPGQPDRVIIAVIICIKRERDALLSHVVNATRAVCHFLRAGERRQQH